MTIRSDPFFLPIGQDLTKNVAQFLSISPVPKKLYFRRIWDRAQNQQMDDSHRDPNHDHWFHFYDEIEDYHWEMYEGKWESEQGKWLWREDYDNWHKLT